MMLSDLGQRPDCPKYGSWERWCDCAFPSKTDPINNAKCKHKPFHPSSFFPPWDPFGAQGRNIPGGTPLASVLAAPFTLFSSREEFVEVPAQKKPGFGGFIESLPSWAIPASVILAVSLLGLSLLRRR